MLVVLSKFTIANGMIEQVRQAFVNRPHLVDDASGFIRMEVLSPAEASEEIWLMTWWKDRDAFDTWHKSHEYKSSHEFIPKGLKLVPKSWELKFFEQIST